MEITFLGTGDSAGVPQIGCRCETCQRYIKQGKERTRFSLFFETKKGTILIDTSPDLRSQFLRENINNVDSVVFTHAHYDHYAGLGDFYRISKNLPIYGAPEVLDPIKNRYRFLSFIEPKNKKPKEEFKLSGLYFQLVPVHHPPINSYGIIIKNKDKNKKVVITGDTSRSIPENSLELMKSPDLLIADAIVPSKGDFPKYIQNKLSKNNLSFANKHMTYEGAIELSKSLNAKKTRLVHLSHYFKNEYKELAEDGEKLKI